MHDKKYLLLLTTLARHFWKGKCNNIKRGHFWNILFFHKYSNITILHYESIFVNLLNLQTLTSFSLPTVQLIQHTFLTLTNFSDRKSDPKASEHGFQGRISHDYCRKMGPLLQILLVSCSNQLGHAGSNALGREQGRWWSISSHYLKPFPFCYFNYKYYTKCKLRKRDKNIRIILIKYWENTTVILFWSVTELCYGD